MEKGQRINKVSETTLSPTFLSNQGFKGIVVSPASPSLHRGSLEISSLRYLFRSTGESVSVFSCDSKDGASDVQLDIAR